MFFHIRKLLVYGKERKDERKKNFFVLALQYRMRTYECRTFFAYKEIINKNVSTLQTNG